ncbi:MAG: hypothetical protein IPJ65_34045 [Archangiaceae bacterium]|nr:hypothetical protein [Archangiaceae bacterium]
MASSISLKRLSAFAPPSLETTLRAEGQTSFTVPEVEALAARYRDSEDFEAARYLDKVLTSLAAPPTSLLSKGDPLRRDAARAAQVSKHAQALIGATGMPQNHAVLFAKASYSVEQARQAWQVELPGGQAFMYARLGLNPDQAIALGREKVDRVASYQLVEAGAPPELVGALLAAGLDAAALEKHRARGFGAAEALALKELGVGLSEVPDGLSVEQLKQVAARGHRFSRVRTLMADGGFTFEEAMKLLALPSTDVRVAANLKKLGLTFAEISDLMQSPTLERHADKLVDLIKAGFSRAQLDRLDCPDKVRPGVFQSGYSPEQLLALFEAGAERSTRSSAPTLGTLYQAGFTVAQAIEAQITGLEERSIPRFQALGFTAAEMLALARAGYGSETKLQSDYLCIGITAREAYPLITAT